MKKELSLRSIRPLAAESLRGVKPGKVTGKRPKPEWVDPTSIYVEEDYQREVQSSGINLVRRIYAGFNWARFKPPICVRLPESGNVLVCIDGQHTATAAASHPDIDQILVLVVDAASVADRASAFVGHNRDRLALTPVAIYRAELHAGDEVAAIVDRACRAAGASVPRGVPSFREKVAVGVTVALGTLKIVARRQGEEMLTRVLKLLVAAGRGPIRADEIAAATICCKFLDPTDDARLLAVVASKSGEQWCADGRQVSIGSGEAAGAEVARLWLNALKAPVTVPAARSQGKSAAADAVRAVAPIKPVKSPPPTPKKPPAPVAPPQVVNGHDPKKPAPNLDPNRYVERNGVVVDMIGEELARRGVRVALGPDMPVVAALARVMPALLDFGLLEKKAFGRLGHDGQARLRAAAERVNPRLATAGLEIKVIPKMGMTLSEVA